MFSDVWSQPAPAQLCAITASRHQLQGAEAGTSLCASPLLWKLQSAKSPLSRFFSKLENLSVLGDKAAHFQPHLQGRPPSLSSTSASDCSSCSQAA